MWKGISRITQPQSIDATSGEICGSTAGVTDFLVTRSGGTSKPSILGAKIKGSQFAILDNYDEMDMDRGALNEGEISGNRIQLGAMKDD